MLHAVKQGDILIRKNNLKETGDNLLLISDFGLMPELPFLRTERRTEKN